MDGRQRMKKTAPPPPPSLFPALEAWAARPRGKVPAAFTTRLRRALGQGKTRALGVDWPPAPIERRHALAGLALPPGLAAPAEVEAEILEARRASEEERAATRGPAEIRRFAADVIRRLQATLGPDAAGQKDGQYHAGGFILVHDRTGANWAWSLTKHHPIVSRIPPDPDYVFRAHGHALATVTALILPPEVFERRLALSHAMASALGAGEDVLIQDVARCYRVAAQSDTFWKRPARRLFADVPDGAFVANLVAWRRSRPETRFTFVPATLNQSMGPKAKAFHLPTNAEGTMTRPVIYLRRHAPVAIV